MIIKEIDGAFEKITELYPDDLELIVAAANIAGYLECAEILEIESDSELSTFCVRLVQKYYRETDVDTAFPEFAETNLIQRFGIKNNIS